MAAIQGQVQRSNYHIALGFWLRRLYDGSFTEFRVGLHRLLSVFDPEFIQSNEDVLADTREIERGR